jgi:hypothetical protein
LPAIKARQEADKNTGKAPAESGQNDTKNA